MDQQGPNSNPQLSVVTTVWGMTGGAQTGPQSSYSGNGSTGPPHLGGMGGGPTSAPGGIPPANYNSMKAQQQQHQQSYWNQNQGMGSSYAHSQQRTESSGQGSSGDPNYNPNSNPLGVTAMVTAIATATATATASVVAFQERQDGNHYQHQQHQVSP